MNKTLLLSALISLSSFSSVICKDSIIKYNLIRGKIITAEDFSSMTFDEANLTDDQYNNLSSSEQFKIYEKVKPLDQKARETSKGLNYMKEEVMDTMRMISILGVPEGMTYEDLNKVLKLYEELESIEANLNECV